MFTPALREAEAPRLLGELRELLRLAVPVAAAQAGIALMGVVDTAVVGRLGAAALGAVGLANGIFIAVGVIGIGTVMGLDPLVAQAFGAKDRPRTRALIWQGAWLSLIVSAVLAMPLALGPHLIDAAGIEPEVARGAKQFLWARLPGLFPLLLFVALRAYLQAAAMDCDGRLFVASNETIYAFITDDRGLADAPWPTYRRDSRATGNFGAPKYGMRLPGPDGGVCNN